MAVPEMRHGHIHAPILEKRNTNVFTRRKTCCVSGTRDGRGRVAARADEAAW
jgi:hypothetical protein